MEDYKKLTEKFYEQVTVFDVRQFMLNHEHLLVMGQAVRKDDAGAKDAHGKWRQRKVGGIEPDVMRTVRLCRLAGEGISMSAIRDFVYVFEESPFTL